MTPAIAFLDGKFTADLPMYVNDAALSLSANASQVLAKRYLRRGPDGELETPAGLFYRVARFVGRADLDHGCTTRITDRTIERFYQLLSTARFLPNTPTFTGAGTPLGQLAACFVLPLADDMGKEPEGIFNTMRDAALIQQTGGGNGFSFGRLRRKGARVATSQGAASGPVSFLEVFDKAFGAVAQGGSRRGANMAVLPCLAGDTEIHTLAGKVAIKDLVGQRPYVYACDTLTRKTHVVQADAVFVSGENRAVVRVWMDNDEYIDCTPDHRFLLRDGTYKEAGSLALGDSLMAFEKAIVQHGNSSRFIATIGATGAHGEYEHRVVARDILGEHVDGNHHVHHIDGNPLNNLPANLMVVSRSEHAKLHNDLLLATQQAIAKRRKGKTLVETYGIEKATAWKQKMAEAKRGRQAIANHRVVKVEPIGVADKVYDITLPAYHNFVANEVFVHNCNHPDIIEFITCKAEEGRIANFNISVAVTDAFMYAVRADAQFELINPEDGTVARTVQAREIYDLIVKYAHKNGEPGMLFIDAANASNPVPHIAQYEATNPCVTGDTLIYTAFGLHRADALHAAGTLTQATLDSRFGEEATFSPASSAMIKTGRRPVYQLRTKEGYNLKATGDHRIMTPEGWAELSNLTPGRKVHILNRKGGFGQGGSLPEGRVMGWLMGDGTFNIGGNVEGKAALMFFGDEQALAPEFAGYVNELLVGHKHQNVAHPERQYSVGVLPVEERAETRIVSARLKHYLADRGFTNKEAIPDAVFTGGEEMQRGFLQGLFSADGTVSDNVDKGVSVRLWSNNEAVLEGTQRLLLNFGVASKIFRDRKEAGEKAMPDGRGGQKDYQVKAGHELVVSKDNLFRFQSEIGFVVPAKAAKLGNAMASYGKRGPYAEYYLATVESVALVGVETVYDLNEPLTHSFIANGIVVHNCGEQFLLPYENCCLGSINLAKHVGLDTFGDLVVDWADLAATISDAVHFLDNVVTANAYVPAVPKLREAGLRARRIGLGIMGLGDLFYLLGVRYGSEEGQELAGQIMEFVRYHAMARSVTLAVARGTFPAYRGSVYQKDTWRTPEPLVPFSRSYRRPHLDWEFLREQIRTHGIRNAAQTTIAPTGTLSTVADCEGYGCEPVFALGYIRHFKDGDRDVTLPYTSPLFELALGATRLSDERKAAVRAYVAEYGTCQTLSELPLALRNTFVVSADITAEEHVRMQAALQTFVDNSLSKTCNFPAGATEADVDRAYQLAWELGCKGLTVYVTGSRTQVVLETKATQAAKATPDAEPVSLTDAYAQLTITPQGVIIDGENRFNAVMRMANHLVERQRPDKLQGTTYKKQTPLGAAYVTVNVDAEGEPFETFINIGKAGSETAAISEAVGRLISYILRMPSPLAPGARLGEVAQSLMGIGGSRSFGFGAKKVQSLADAIGQVLGSHLIGDHTHDDDEEAPAAAPSPTIESTTRPAGELCPECGEAALLNTEGCKKCYACNYTEC